MEPQAAFLNDLITLVNQFGLFAPVRIGQLPDYTRHQRGDQQRARQRCVL